jgi:aryl-alcohol dehydrogenase-like predicted oxidoreductase
MSIREGLKNSKIGYIWLKNEKKIVLAVGIILIAAISFEAGYLQGQKNKNDSIVINKVESSDIKYDNQSNKNATLDNSPAVQTTSQPENQKISNQACAYVASKNSDKYHLPTCRYAQNIKPENRVCFSSKEEAESKGFVGAKCCIK